MRRTADSWVNATQILKVAGIPKSTRTKILEKEVLTGMHEKVQGGCEWTLAKCLHSSVLTCRWKVPRDMVSLSGTYGHERTKLTLAGYRSREDKNLQPNMA